jgi:hypothetical protein
MPVWEQHPQIENVVLALPKRRSDAPAIAYLGAADEDTLTKRTEKC